MTNVQFEKVWSATILNIRILIRWLHVHFFQELVRLYVCLLSSFCGNNWAMDFKFIVIALLKVSSVEKMTPSIDNTSFILSLRLSKTTYWYFDRLVWIYRPDSYSRTRAAKMLNCENYYIIIALANFSFRLDQIFSYFRVQAQLYS